MGEYVLVHVGFALSRIDSAEAVPVLEFLAGKNLLEEVAAAGGPPPSTD